jgi:hypothetical protein
MPSTSQSTLRRFAIAAVSTFKFLWRSSKSSKASRNKIFSRQPGAGNPGGDNTPNNNKRLRGNGGQGRGGDGALVKRKDFVPVKNPNPVAAWALKPDENYSTVFFNNLPSAPKFNGKAFCAMYHIKGVCNQGEDCYRKASHTTLDSKMGAEVTKWIKNCRAGAQNNNDKQE